MIASSYRVVRHQTVGLGEGPYDTADKFRIDFICNKKVVGSRIISSTLVKEGKEVCPSTCTHVNRYLASSVSNGVH